PVAVQGEGAAMQIAAAIAGFNRIAPEDSVPRPDVIIVARGGGSLEDLMPFNEEIVVRAAAASAIPLISAVGHETDTTLIDYAADLRAPTPTAAAELAVPVRLDLIATVESLAGRLSAGLARLFAERRLALVGLARGLPDPQDLIGTAAQRLDDRAERLRLAAAHLLALERGRLTHIAARLRPAAAAVEIGRLQALTRQAGERLARALARALDGHRQALDNFAGRLRSHSERHESLLARGYVVVRDGEARIVTAAAAILPGAALELEFHDGRVGVAAGPPPRKRAAPRRREADSPAQGRLFG
ncbi:MAG TPA: exodeoxyribonuclease VII large subunit, partial [Stellaceae bacterium]|nr:exodeoxyribonuclease VII large subunit [Stellaceae bacterium]